MSEARGRGEGGRRDGAGPRPRRDSRGRHTGGPVRLSAVLGNVASELGAGRADVVRIVFGQWEELVGPAVAAHVRPLRVDGDTLVVSADHSAWATQMRHLAPDILATVADACGATEAPQRLEVRVRR